MLISKTLNRKRTKILIYMQFKIEKLSDLHILKHASNILKRIQALQF